MKEEAQDRQGGEEHLQTKSKVVPEDRKLNNNNIILELAMRKD